MLLALCYSPIAYFLRYLLSVKLFLVQELIRLFSTKVSFNEMLLFFITGAGSIKSVGSHNEENTGHFICRGSVFYRRDALTNIVGSKIPELSVQI